jgi:acyl-CoA thioesterase
VAFGGYGSPMQRDVDFLGLRDEGEGRFTFSVDNHLARMDGHLYGGTAIAVSMVAAELSTDRATVWMTTQFVATAPPSEQISVRAEVLASGRRANQVRVTGTDSSGETMFASLGTTGLRQEHGLEGVFEAMPTVSAPGDSEMMQSLFTGVLRNAGYPDAPPMPEGIGFGTVIEFRDPVVEVHPDPGPGRMCVWVRRKDREPVTPAMVAYMADMVPLSVAHACGVVAGGISLDNSIRVGSFVECEWVLLDLRPHMVSGDYGHGAVHAWSEGGQLLATASQSASMLRFDMDNSPWLTGKG